jgi:hypothetical protein
MLKGISIEFATVPDPVPSSKWVNSSEKERINNINAAMQNFPGHEQMEIKSALTNGQVSLELKVVMAANERGVFLLDFEEWIKKMVDTGISIWHVPIGDKNSLRNLRGIEVAINEDL